jgi:hypothetical protein
MNKGEDPFHIMVDALVEDFSGETYRERHPIKPKQVTVQQIRGGKTIKEFQASCVQDGRIQTVTFPQDINCLSGDEVTIL